MLTFLIWRRSSCSSTVFILQICHLCICRLFVYLFVCVSPYFFFNVFGAQNLKRKMFAVEWCEWSLASPLLVFIVSCVFNDVNKHLHFMCSQRAKNRQLKTEATETKSVQRALRRRRDEEPVCASVKTPNEKWNRQRGGRQKKKQPKTGF